MTVTADPSAYFAEAFPDRPSYDAGFEPTGEQAAALDLFLSGKSLAVQARAGTGKTSTLRLMAGSVDAPGTYVAFNRAIVDEARRKMPRNVGSHTAHALAMRAVGARYRHRLDGARIRSWELANLLDVRDLTVRYGQAQKRLSGAFLASLALRSISLFCASADPAPSRRHVPYIEGIDQPEADLTRTWASNDAVRDTLEPVLARAWADLSADDGRLPFGHDHYLKLWQLQDPVIPGEFILFDEAQDASPVMLAAVEAQAGRQLVFVGDSCQQIYEWRGAVDALDHVPADATAYLRQSFRFGPAIAERANTVLAVVGPSALLVGTPAIPSTVGPLASAKAYLTRTNAAAVGIVLAEQAAGRLAHLVGGGGEVIRFARAALDVKEGRGTDHPDLACFTTWAEVQEYVGEDPQGDELGMLVKLVDEFGVGAILHALERMPPEDDADVVVSTAHKAKGREWESVILWDDFQANANPGELRLAYVAATRARLRLDPTRCPTFTFLDSLGDGEAARG